MRHPVSPLRALADRFHDTAREIVSQVQMRGNAANLTSAAASMASAQRSAWKEVIDTLRRMRIEDMVARGANYARKGPPDPVYALALRFAADAERAVPRGLKAIAAPCPPCQPDPVDRADVPLARVAAGLRQIAVEVWEAQPWPEFGEVRQAMWAARAHAFRRLAGYAAELAAARPESPAACERIVNYAAAEFDQARYRASTLKH